MSDRPGPMELWHQAGGGTPDYDRDRYLSLLREHGHLLSPGDEGYGEAPRNLPCGWPARAIVRDCQIACDEDCECGPVHCIYRHEPNHKRGWHDPEKCDAEVYGA